MANKLDWKEKTKRKKTDYGSLFGRQRMNGEMEMTER